jgi:predicted glycosyltransferase
MNILISIEHPAHVHLFKNFIWALEKKHNIVIVAFDKDITIDLLDKYGFKYINLKSYGKTLIAKGLKMPLMSLKIGWIALKYKIDILMGVSIFAAQAGFLTRKKSYIFTDTEHAREQIALFKPFATKIYTPDCFLDDLGKKQVRYPGYHELAYLHPKRFKPNPDVLKELGINIGEKFFVVRFVSWNASHDIGLKSLSFENQKKLVDLLSQHGRIIISSEKPLQSYFEPYRMSVCPTKMHDLLYYATMYIGEGGTMASEAAVLGTYSILVNPLKAGTFEELKTKYRLLVQEVDTEKVIVKIKDFLNRKEILSNFISQHEIFLKDKIDVTGYFLKEIYN